MGNNNRFCLTLMVLTCTVPVCSRQAVAASMTQVQVSVSSLPIFMCIPQNSVGTDTASASTSCAVGSANGQASVFAIVGSSLFPDLMTGGHAVAEYHVNANHIELAAFSETLLVTGASGVGSIVYQFASMGHIVVSPNFPLPPGNSQLVVSQGGSASTLLPCGLFAQGCNTVLLTTPLPFTFGVPFAVSVALSTSSGATGFLEGNGTPTFGSSDASVISQFQNAAVFDSFGQPVSRASIQILPNVPQPGPDLQVLKSHIGDFTPGQVGATYTLQVLSFGTAPPIGPVQVVDNLPAGLTATAIGGSGWDCSLATLTCRHPDDRIDRRYAPITLMVNVAPNAPALVINTATVSGGGDVNTSNNTATDPTNITTIGGRSR